MTTDPGHAAPHRPLHEMTTSELSRSRSQLERALQRMTAQNPGRAPLQQQLTAIRALLQARAQTQGGPAPAARPLPPGTYHLTARIFAGLFTDYDLHNVTSGYIALPKGTPMFTGTSVGDVARQISTASGYEQPRPADR
jgi:AraC-like DNA-binding protein